MNRVLNNRELKLFSKTVIKSDAQIIITTISFIALSYLLSILYSRLSGYSEYTARVFEAFYSGRDIAEVHYPKVESLSVVLAVLVYGLSIIISDGYSCYCLMRSRLVPVGFRAIFPRSVFMVKIIVIEIVGTAVTAVASLFFVFPGIILGYAYRMAIYVMVDNPELSAIGCLRRSRQLMRGHKMRLFVLDLSFIGWLVLSSVVSTALAPVVDIWLMPYMGIATAAFYNNVIGLNVSQTGTPGGMV